MYIHLSHGRATEAGNLDVKLKNKITSIFKKAYRMSYDFNT